jgi:hypothetical protein
VYCSRTENGTRGTYPEIGSGTERPVPAPRSTTTRDPASSSRRASLRQLTDHRRVERVRASGQLR